MDVKPAYSDAAPGYALWPPRPQKSSAVMKSSTLPSHVPIPLAARRLVHHASGRAGVKAVASNGK